MNMNNFVLSLNAVLPLFFIMMSGYLAKRAGIIKEENVSPFNKVAFQVFAPVLLFNNIYASDFSHAVRPDMLMCTFIMVLAAFGLGWIYAKFRVREKNKRSVAIQAIFRSNVAIVGIPIAEALSDVDISPVAVMMALIVPLFNVLAVICLEAYSGEKTDVRHMLADVLKNPLIIGTAAGLLFMLLDIRLPYAAELAVESLSDIASPLMLFLLGAFFRFSEMRKNAHYLTEICIIKLAVIPALFLWLAGLLGFRGIDLISILVVFASPTAINSFTMAQQMGGDGELAGQIIVTTSFLSVISIFCCVFVLKSMALI